MDYVRRALLDPATYRRTLYLLSAFPLGQAWFVALVTVWALCAGLAITPLVIALLLGLAWMTFGFAKVETALAAGLLGIKVASLPAPRWEGRFWSYFRAMLGAWFWRAQAFLFARALIGFPIAVALLTLLAASIGMLLAPLWIPFLSGGAHLGFWRPHTFAESLALIPAGAFLLPFTLIAMSPVASLFGPIASALLSDQADAAGVSSQHHPAVRDSALARGALMHHATLDGLLLLVLVLIWALASGGYFWPIWIALPLAVALGMHAWIHSIQERPRLVRRFGGNSGLAIGAGTGAAAALYFTAVWAITGHGYFWPAWPIFSFGVALGLYGVFVLRASPRNAELTERIETLESTRAGAVDVQDSELKRIERDLHDGAQARLVALGMSLGMAEHTLAESPERAGELLADAREGAEQALRELRDLARGIHPPILADRGLEAAVASLVASTPMRVSLSVDVPARPPSAAESAAYFVIAEAIANAAKHAKAERLDIRIVRTGALLELEVCDDGVGGADQSGSGLLGIRRRVRALDGDLSIESPPEGPTVIRAEIPCE
jgi:signal transduction histidine kinase